MNIFQLARQNHVIFIEILKQQFLSFYQCFKAGCPIQQEKLENDVNMYADVTEIFQKSL